MNHNNFSFRSWLFAVPLRAAIGTMIMILALGTTARFLLNTDIFLQNPIREVIIAIVVSLLGATLAYRHAKKLQQQKRDVGT